MRPRRDPSERVRRSGFIDVDVLCKTRVRCDEPMQHELVERYALVRRERAGQQVSVAIRSSMSAFLVSGCFNPHYNNPACGANGECPFSLVCMEGICRANHDLGADGSTEAGGAIDAASCPAGYVQLAGLPSRYRISGGPGTTADPLGRGTWVMAEADCRDDGIGTHLAIAETKAEHDAFVDVVSGASRWLGVTDRKVEGLGGRSPAAARSSRCGACRRNTTRTTACS